MHTARASRALRARCARERPALAALANAQRSLRSRMWLVVGDPPTPTLSKKKITFLLKNLVNSKKSSIFAADFTN